MLARAIAPTSIATFEAEAERPVNHFEQVPMLVRVFEQTADQQVNLVAAIKIPVEGSCQPLFDPCNPRRPGLAPCSLRYRFVQRRAQAISGTNHVVAADIGVLA